MENKNLQSLQHQVAEIQLSYKSTIKPSLRPKIASSKDAYDVLLQSWDTSKLEFLGNASFPLRSNLLANRLLK